MNTSDYITSTENVIIKKGVKNKTSSKHLQYATTQSPFQ